MDTGSVQVFTEPSNHTSLYHLSNRPRTLDMRMGPSLRKDHVSFSKQPPHPSHRRNAPRKSESIERLLNRTELHVEHRHIIDSTSSGAACQHDALHMYFEKSILEV